MSTFNKQTDPKKIPDLSSNHASEVPSSKGQNVSYKTEPFQKKNSTSFHETKIKYTEYTSTVPDYSKTRSGNVKMPEVTYTEEKIIPRPVADKDKPLRVEKPKVEAPTFTKSMMDPASANPVYEVFQNAATTTETIPVVADDKKVYPKKKAKHKKMTFIILIAILIEVIILGIIYFVKEANSKDVLECTSTNYSDYFHANITNTKRYIFKYGKIVKLIDTTLYKFDTKEEYDEFKNTYAYPPRAVVEGRIIVNNINDNDKTYEEKATYDYPKLRKKNTSTDEHNIVIDTDTLGDQVNLIDYNITDIKIIYEEDYICK